jgi:hypothetical protein
MLNLLTLGTSANGCTFRLGGVSFLQFLFVNRCGAKFFLRH